jgi:hypothetical protein
MMNKVNYISKKMASFLPKVFNTIHLSFIIHHSSFNIRSSLFILHSSLLFTSCVNQNSLSRTQYLLYSQSVSGNRAVPAEALEALIPQKPNKRILRLPFTPALWWYQWGAANYDQQTELTRLATENADFEQQSRQLSADARALRQLTRRHERAVKKRRLRIDAGNGRMRAGEAPSYFNERDARTNLTKLQLYLQNKGFFQAQATFSVDTLLDRRVRVNYEVSENVPFVLRLFRYEIADPAVDSLVQASLTDSPIKVGDRYDADKIRAEAVRIEELLRNNGYYAFSRQYVRATPDSSAGPIPITDPITGQPVVARGIDLWMQVLNPPAQARHPVYRIGEVNVSISRDDVRDASGGVVASDTVVQNGVRYLLQGHAYATRLLDTKIRLRPGQLYRQRDFAETQRQLFLLNQFKFVNLTFADTTNRRLQTRVVATPADKYEYSAEGGLFVLVDGQGYPGPFGNLTFRVRNIFGGLETFETSLRYGLEFQTGFANDVSGTQPLRTTELSLSTSLIFPQILFPGRTRFWFNKFNPRSQVQLSYGNTDRPDFARANFRGTLNYAWQTGPARQFTASLLDLNYLRARFISQQFRQQIDSLQALGSTIFLAYRNAFTSNINGSYTYNTNVAVKDQPTNFLRVAVESGGTTLNLLSAGGIENLRQSLARLTGNDSLELYKYLRLNVDYRHYIPLRGRTTLAFRVNTGVVWGYGSNRTAPYEKLFFVGGANSIRAWPSRRLGPGSAYPLSAPNRSARDEETGEFIYRFESPGNLLLEGSAELRGRLFRLGADVNGAAFVDVGNVWTLGGNSQRPGETFDISRALTDLAVGTGVGVRLDFNYFILRLDAGIKVWDPARRYQTAEGRLVDERFILPRLFTGANPIIPQFGIGYPF